MPKICQKCPKSLSKVAQKSPKSLSKVAQKSLKSRSKVSQKLLKITGDKMSQQLSITFMCITSLKLGHFVAGEKVGHFVRWDNLLPEKCKLNNGFLIHMPEIWPKIAQDISQICPRYAQALPEVWGFKLRKWDKMSPGRVHKLGHYVAGEVHICSGTFCRWDKMSPNPNFSR